MGLYTRPLGAFQSKLYHQGSLPAPGNFSRTQVIWKNTFEGNIKFFIASKVQELHQRTLTFVSLVVGTGQITRLSFLHCTQGHMSNTSGKLVPCSSWPLSVLHTWPAVGTWNQALEKSSLRASAQGSTPSAHEDCLWWRQCSMRRGWRGGGPAEGTWV